jgi:hypothetical protein
LTWVERTIEIDAAPAKVFAFVAAEWETDLGFAGGRRHAWSPQRPARLRPGFRASFDGELLALNGRCRLEVKDFLEDLGWTARSICPPELRWTWRFEAVGYRCRVTQMCDHRPDGVLDRLGEWAVRRGRRADAFEATLLQLKTLVERQMSLERLQRYRPDRPPRPHRSDRGGDR